MKRLLITLLFLGALRLDAQTSTAATAAVKISQAASTFGTVTLTSDVTGVLPVANGGCTGITATYVLFASAGGKCSGAAGFTFASNTLTALNITTANNGKVSSPHFLGINGAGGAPTVAGTALNACGTTAPAIAGTDEAATITVGSVAGTSCTVTFGTAWSVNVPACVASQNGTSTVASVAPTLTDMVIAGTFVAGDKIAYVCKGF